MPLVYLRIEYVTTHQMQPDGVPLYSYYYGPRLTFAGYETFEPVYIEHFEGAGSGETEGGIADRWYDWAEFRISYATFDRPENPFEYFSYPTPDGTSTQRRWVAVEVPDGFVIPPEYTTPPSEDTPIPGDDSWLPYPEADSSPMPDEADLILVDGHDGYVAFESLPWRYDETSDSWSIVSREGLPIGLGAFGSGERAFVQGMANQLSDTIVRAGAVLTNNTGNPQFLDSMLALRNAMANSATVGEVLYTFHTDMIDLLADGIGSISIDPSARTISPEEFDARATQIISDFQADLVNAAIGQITAPLLDVLVNTIPVGRALLSFSDQTLQVEYSADGIFPAIHLPEGHRNGFLGSPGEDLIFDSSGLDIIIAGAGNDVILHSGGSDIIVGGDGDDQVIARGAIVPLIPGFAYQPISATISGGAGYDTIVIPGSDLSENLVVFDLIGGSLSGFEKIVFESNPGQQVQAAIGITDLLLSVGVPLTLVGSAGQDILSASAPFGSGTYAIGTYVLENWDPQVDILAIRVGAALPSHHVTLYANPFYTGRQALNGGAASSTLVGGPGNDILDPGLLGTDSLLGQAGDDVIRLGQGYETAGDSYDGGDGFDTLGIEGDIALSAAIANVERLYLAPFVASGYSIATLQGYVTSPFASDLLIGGTGSISIIAPSTGADFDASQWRFESDADVSVVFGGSGAADTFSGSSLDEHIYGLGGADILMGGDGDDYIEGFQGRDLIDGGGGFDTASYLNASAGVTINLAATTWQQTNGAGLDWLVRIEDVVGSLHDDELRGNELGNLLAGASGDDRISGLGGNDYLRGSDGNDLLFGGAGNDQLAGDAGADELRGGAGNDHYIVTDGFDTVIEAAGAGTDTVESYIDRFALPSNVENLILQNHALAGIGNDLDNLMTGSGRANELNGRGGNDVLHGHEGGDTLRGQDGDDALWGGLGHDDLFGGGGDDTLQGDGGNDRVYGNAGNDFVNGGLGNDNVFGGGGNDNVQGGNGADILNGHAGNDLIVGGPGNDLLVGGPGADRFLFNPGHLGAGLSATDRIKDFSHAQGDKIDLHNLAADTNAGGNQAFNWIGNASFGGVAGQLRYATVGNTTTVYGDTDGDGTADFALWLTGQIGLTAGDFVL